MTKFYEKYNRVQNVLSLIFKILFLTVGFMQASSITFGKPIISIVQWPTVFLGCLLILYRLIFFKHYINTRGIWILVVFALGYVASSLHTAEYGLYINFRYLMFMVMQFAILYAFDSKESPEQNKKQFNICAFYYLAVAALLSFTSFMFMIFGFSKIFFPEPGVVGPIYYYGFVHGRLFGAYWDPNIAATLAAIAIIISLYFITKYKKPVIRVLLSLNAFLQIMYITFSDSRTGKLSLAVGLFVFTLMYVAKKRIFKNTVLQTLSVAVITLAVVSTSYTVPKITKIIYNDVSYKLAEIKDDNGEDPDGEKDEFDIPDNVLDRGYDTGEDISNRRFDIWGAAVDIFKTSPIVGVSRANILPYVDDKLPDSYLVTNDHMRFESMHNLMFEILASQGLVGVIAFVLFAAWVVLGILKNFKYIWNSKNFNLFTLFISIAAVTCTSTLVMAEIVYVVSPISTLFWLSIGSIGHFIYSSKKEK